MNLIIVESPTKAKTISKFLDKKYQVESSFGHIRDLPKSEMGIDIENNFVPRYVVPLATKKTVANLKKVAAKAENVILASDEDREGEAIAWHLAEVLNLDKKKTERIVFHEITKEAIKAALEKPRHLDNKLIDAQQARRILDRLVGYELSPFLWKKVARGLSAGRVQSVAIRLIVEREKEIKAFISQTYWSLEAELEALKDKDSRFIAALYKINNKTFDKLSIDKTKADELEADLKQADYQILKIEKKKLNKNAPAPFTTSTLQQSANRLLGYSAKQTMVIAQKLYEQGYITYMRTDSLNLSGKFLSEAKIYLEETLGKEYGLNTPRVFKNRSKNAQEAHEAIRPTEAANSPEKIKAKLDKGFFRLYQLIWQRALASQMPAAILDATIIDVTAITSAKAKEYILRATGQTLNFPGYLKIYPEKTAEQELPSLKEKDDLKLIKLNKEEHATKPPARYSDAGLVKELEKYGIGRPSTYAPTISTVITRNYVERDLAKKLAPTAIAFVVTDLLTKHFPEIIDYKFTAKLEDDLDSIADGAKKWQPVIKTFYDKFHENLTNKYSELNKQDIMPEEKSEEICDKCGSSMIIKTGRYGKFLACSNFPTCHNIKKMAGGNGAGGAGGEVDEATKALQEKYAGTACDKCGADMVVKNGKFGPFLACSAYPKCKNIKNIDAKGGMEKDIPCPACGVGKIVKKFSRRGAFYACNNYPNCKNAYWGEPTGEKCPDCGALLVREKGGQIKCSDRSCGHEE
ncbi:MAG: type I DNA topoisomerase [Candidatus Falkowbacteria bacterium]|nr:type I DNA topoisomerase [Candidatus Falkowbacteria bacterium]